MAEYPVTLTEVICFGVDALLFGIFYKLYRNSKKASEAVKEAPIVEINEYLKDSIKATHAQAIPYAIIKGTVRAFKQALHSHNKPNVRGVVQEVVLKEHQIKWSWATRWWLETEREISRSKNYVPFLLIGKKGRIYVQDPLEAKIINLTTISDKFEPSVSGFGEAVWGFFTGARTQGFQETEQMLLEGTMLTGIGRLAVNKTGDVCLQPPAKGLYYFLTQVPESTLIKNLDVDTNFLKVMSVLCGVVGAAILINVVKKMINEHKKEKAIKARKQILAELISDRSRFSNTEINTQAPPCVICLANPREVVILDCGHVCCCADCAQNLSTGCPICRQPISQFWPAYIS
uniref:RING-type E3 ubiquitin transferase n=1 Tax=Strigamia maritima TaxID=126957 RepID=T1ITY3_STRMM